MEKLIARINELYHKSKESGLTPEEKEEQIKLRKIYVSKVTGNLTSQLNQINIQNEDGSIENLGEKYGSICKNDL